jgi:hypothetical protein
MKQGLRSINSALSKASPNIITNILSNIKSRFKEFRIANKGIKLKDKAF